MFSQKNIVLAENIIIVWRQYHYDRDGEAMDHYHQGYRGCSSGKFLFLHFPRKKVG